MPINQHQHQHSVLRELIISGKLVPEAAIMNASRVCMLGYWVVLPHARHHLPHPPQVVDPFVVHVAAQRALTSLHGAGTTTKTLHSELVYNVGASRGVCGCGVPRVYMLTCVECAQHVLNIPSMTTDT